MLFEVGRKPGLIIFDCDGVLIDSEGVASSVIAADMTALGWPMTMAEAMNIFIGMSIQDMQPLIEARLARPLPESWRGDLAAKLLSALKTNSRIVPGAKEMLEEVSAQNISWCVASNSSLREMHVKFERTGLSELTAGRAYGAEIVIAKGGRPKPAPDLFLYAAEAHNIAPADCLVLEDSALGVTGAVAAGMTVIGFAPHGDGAHLRAAGAAGIVTSTHEFTEQIALMLEEKRS